jgi:predicted transcriptional regulator
MSSRVSRRRRAPGRDPRGPGAPPRGKPAAEWTFLTNHAHVLIYLEREPGATLRRVAEAAGITERAVQRIVAELEEAGFLSRSRQGRRNVYAIHAGLPLRHPIESHRTVEDLLTLVNEGPPRRDRRSARRASRRSRDSSITAPSGVDGTVAARRRK